MYKIHDYFAFFIIRDMLRQNFQIVSAILDVKLSIKICNRKEAYVHKQGISYNDIGQCVYVVLFIKARGKTRV